MLHRHLLVHWGGAMMEIKTAHVKPQCSVLTFEKQLLLSTSSAGVRSLNLFYNSKPLSCVVLSLLLRWSSVWQEPGDPQHIRYEEIDPAVDFGDLVSLNSAEKLCCGPRSPLLQLCQGSEPHDAAPLWKPHRRDGSSMGVLHKHCTLL